MINRGSYMSAHVLLSSLNELREERRIEALRDVLLIYDTSSKLANDKNVVPVLRGLILHLTCIYSFLGSYETKLACTDKPDSLIKCLQKTWLTKSCIWNKIKTCINFNPQDIIEGHEGPSLIIIIMIKLRFVKITLSIHLSNIWPSHETYCNNVTILWFSFD